ncbi:MAG: hypothetical protein LBR95_09975 [Azoarcus sp.]|nr:hypothetical protein [Azoarcus sp.]
MFGVHEKLFRVHEKLFGVDEKLFGVHETRISLELMTFLASKIDSPVGGKDFYAPSLGGALTHFPK